MRCHMNNVVQGDACLVIGVVNELVIPWSMGIRVAFVDLFMYLILVVYVLQSFMSIYDVSAKVRSNYQHQDPLRLLGSMR